MDKQHEGITPIIHTMELNGLLVQFGDEIYQIIIDSELNINIRDMDNQTPTVDDARDIIWFAMNQINLNKIN
ncbi:hypothetical protein [Shewanella sp. SE1]|uniref:hypothetical protein n=1 Tax=Shewanella sp. SE1 TaxID=2705014 RepID=UPI00138F3FFE|nr:hypothetical protein [Shewanella sp. SE1]NDO73062.1 hypothetical protein [Shewanella sp. SE1]